MIETKYDDSSTAFERLPVAIYPDEYTASIQVAKEVTDLIKKNNQNDKNTILGLATGASPIAFYNEMVRIHKEENLSFGRVVTFNLDEYYPMASNSRLSYNFFMRYHFFDHVDIKSGNIHIPKGNIGLDEVSSFCKDYENKINGYGGIDIQILGIGRTGHVGFNEPPSHINTLTRLVKLDPVTISDATREFVREDLVPRRAITMGIQSIFKAKKIYLFAWGGKKAKILKDAVEGPITKDIPASYLQDHPNVQILCDGDASVELTRIKTPWVVSLVEWSEQMAKSAVIWLSNKLHKPILKLTEEDYKTNDLGDLIVYYGNYHDLNIKIFNTLQQTITGWPAGKPNADDKTRPERALPAKKRVLIFSPHPDDDVISMGGTFLRLVEQGHEVHVAYQTSGNIAVFDDDAIRFSEFALDLLKVMEWSDAPKIGKLYENITSSLENKDQDASDTIETRLIKGLIRKGEASSAARFCGLNEDQIHFLNMPFYETGTVEKGNLSEDDYSLIIDVIRKVKPHQVFAAGDLRDPHGTHKTCLDAILESLKRLKKKESWIDDCWLWLYRGAWQEWPIEEIQMAVPISPSDLIKKRKAIFKHQSQKDSPVFPGTDDREFWQRAEDRNRFTAKTYDELGLTEYEAMEAFVRYEY